MNGSKKNEERDAVLFAFHQECEKPTAMQILDWVRRYPEYAEDIRAHAAVSHDWAARKSEEEVEVSQSLLDRGFSNALNALHNARVEAEEPAQSKSFHDLAAAQGIDVVQMAQDMDIARGVLAELFDGAMRPPVRKRIVDAVCDILKISRAMFDAALSLALQQPRFGHAKANGPPTVNARTCDQIIRESRMTPERKRYWLEED
ncbi:hypothetical protein [Hoeflea poritis]|uniref:HTH cro/C1-type domain-containing protein n=1 Tax=Hoeflea poritis TaxID=2993659 RepID=A0ABT4VVN8_9HYPH|nr:hypothetical protein [Hoeflea poritis]MDA4848780.1 hypothetical protein [Hoeflea poritis]